MLELITLSQLVIIIGFILLLAAILIGDETGIEIGLIGTILIIGGLVGSFAGNTSLMLVICIVLGILYIAFGRSYIKNKLDTVYTPTNTNRLVGSTGTVTQAITPTHTGRVRIDSEDWRATSQTSIPKDTIVTVTHVSGVTLTVTPA